MRPSAFLLACIQAARPVAWSPFDAQNEVRDVMPAAGHVRDRLLDRGATDDRTVADVENAVLGERGHVQIVVLE
jgi:hypothetical protein